MYSTFCFCTHFAQGIDTQGTDQPLPHETLPRSGRATRWTNTPVTLRKGQLNRHTRYHTFRVVTYVFTCNSKFTPHFRRALFYLESDVVGKSAATLAACTAGLPRSVG